VVQHGINVKILFEHSDIRNCKLPDDRDTGLRPFDLTISLLGASMIHPRRFKPAGLSPPGFTTEFGLSPRPSRILHALSACTKKSLETLQRLFDPIPL